MRFFNARRSSHHTDAKLFDEVIYTPYSFDGPARPTSSASGKGAVGDLLGVPELAITPPTPAGENGPPETPSPALYSHTDNMDSATALPPTKRTKRRARFDRFGEENVSAEVFLFEYGTVVFWGMSELQEKRFLTSM